MLNSIKGVLADPLGQDVDVWVDDPLKPAAIVLPKQSIRYLDRTVITFVVGICIQDIILRTDN